MRLIKTTSTPPPDAPRLKSRRSLKTTGLIIWMIALTIMLIVVLSIFAHLSLVFTQLEKNLA